VEIFTTDVAVARVGAACLGVGSTRSPWANPAAVGANHALTPNAVLAAGRTGARLRVVSWPLPAGTQRFAQQMSAELLPTVNETRKQKTVHKTRINAGGYGAMGPHPEREQPA
jgi:hypothetical protein